MKWNNDVLADLIMSSDALSSRKFALVFLAIVKAECVAIIAIVLGNGQASGGIEPS